MTRSTTSTLKEISHVHSQARHGDRISSAGPGFFVRLIAPDAKGGQEVLRRAKLLLG
jgi:hypothetical protein